MKVVELALPGLCRIEPVVFRDDRGEFVELYHVERYAERKIGKPFVQDNMSCSTEGVLRGLHYQLGHPQAKLVMVVHGEIFDVAVDIRRGSPTFGKWDGAVLSSQNRHQLFIPEGFAHGFCVLGKTATVVYKCTDYYAPSEERGVRWDDPGLGIAWPVAAPILSDKDRAYAFLSNVPPEDLPPFGSLS